MNSLSQFSPPGRGLIIAAALALVIGMMKLAAPLLVPVLLAIFIAIITTPGLNWMRRKGVPKWLALGVIAFVLLDIGSLLALVTTGALEGFRESMPSYQERFMLLSQQFGGWMERVGVGGSTEAIPDLLDPNKVMAGVRLLLSNASGVFMTMLLVLLMVIFILLEVRTMPGKLRAAFGITPEGEARIGKLMRAINHYMRIKSLTSLATAICVYVLLLMVGIDFAALWAVLAFFLNFVPVVGNIIMMIPATLLALIQADVGTALVVAAGYLAINTVIGNVIEPRVMGKGLGISTLAVFLALLFWGWLFGPVGMFLAVPLTASLIIALDASPHTRPLAILLGPEIDETPETVTPLGEPLSKGADVEDTSPRV
jgi:predicted PurR-regulated permease PerM